MTGQIAAAMPASRAAGENVPMLQLIDVNREFAAVGGPATRVLDSINLSIETGDMVAIIGPSGSGKSTLMNILGCLDRPTSGRLLVQGIDAAAMHPEALARLRREHFGFIFQRYQLLSSLDAIANVEMPAIYADVPPVTRRARAVTLLERLGLGARMDHRPNQLSGGQQQRVSIARALMNGGHVILADEPTGALDQASGQDVLEILKDLHGQGHTVIVVTHDPHVAAHADRVIEVRDGRVVRDDRVARGHAVAEPPTTVSGPSPVSRSPVGGTRWGRLLESFDIALRSMRSHKLRTLLTMLGIIIGISSVVSVIALGEGSKQKILSDISALGTNTVEVLPGTGPGDRLADTVRTLTADDAEALASLPFVDSATPTMTSSANVRSAGVEALATVNGVGWQYFRVRGLEFVQGGPFAHQDVARLGQQAVIDTATRERLFPGQKNVIGEVMLVSGVPVSIAGVTAPEKGVLAGTSLSIWLPYTSVAGRLGDSQVSSLTVRLEADASSVSAERAIERLLRQRHGGNDFFLSSSDSIRKTIESTTQTITLLISSIALISLLVGGIGVMNIMLVSVTERIQEIGVRMAVGARQSDILAQFLIEAILVCMIGGGIGLGVALSLAGVVALLDLGIRMVISPWSLLGAVGVSSAIGIGFGFLPARSASRLDPVKALSSR
ncbi:Macrolide export ATP-binding/permease protein MacB [compost metagenome]